ncbi:MAG: alpha-E domain-containing protein [Treponema sp.]
MDTLTVARLDNLFWLGRYVERVYQTIRSYMTGYDKMIDSNENCYHSICVVLGIPDTYSSKEDFITRFGFDSQDSFSIVSNANRAYDNAMLIRDEISTDTLAYIHLAISDLQKAKNDSSPMIFMQKVLDDILAFWGCLDDEVYEGNIRNTVKVGKRIERLDLYTRLKKSKEELQREFERLHHRIKTSSLKYSKAALMHVAALVEEDSVNYNEILSQVSRIIPAIM